MSVDAYRQAVCTRVIALLSPPTNEDLAARFADRTLPLPAVPVAAIAPAPERVIVPLRTLPWESCLALVVVGVAVGLLACHVATSTSRGG